MALALIHNTDVVDDSALTTLLDGLSRTRREELLAQAVQTLALAQRQEQAYADLAVLLVTLERFGLLWDGGPPAAISQWFRMAPEAIERCDALAVTLPAVELDEWCFIVLSLKAELLLTRMDGGQAADAMRAATEAYDRIPQPGHLAKSRLQFHAGAPSPEEWATRGRPGRTTSDTLNDLICAIDRR